MSRFLLARNYFRLFLAACLPASHAFDLPSGYEVTWEDDFTGSQLDESKWFYRGTGVRNDAVNTPDAVSVGNGQLTITTYTESGTHYTGMIATKDSSLNQVYGYYEASIEFKGSSGMWSAFWLQSNSMGTVGNTGKYGTEVDIVEYRSHPRNESGRTANANSALHWHGYGSDHQVSDRFHDGYPDPKTGFHTYGVLWTAGGYTFYIDGVEVWKTTEAISAAAEIIILSSEVNSGSWASNIPSGGYGSRDSSTTRMNVDYVKVYGLSESTWNSSVKSGEWDGGNWTTSLNTGGSSVQVANGGNIWFKNAADTTVTISGTGEADSLTIRNSDNLRFAGDGTLAVNSGIAVLDNNSVTVDTALSVNKNNTWTLFEGGTFTVNGTTEGAGNLTLQENNGNGATYVFNGGSMRTGKTYLGAGTAVVAGADQALGSGAISLSGGSRISASGGRDIVLSNKLELASGAAWTFYFGTETGGKLVFNSTQDTTFGGYQKTFNVASGTSVELGMRLTSSNAPTQRLIKSGAGTLILTGANTYSFETALTEGTLLVGNDSAISSNRLIINGNTTIGTAGDDDVSLSNVLTLESGAARTFNFASAGKGKLTFTAAELSLGGYGKNFNVSTGTTVEFTTQLKAGTPGSPQSFVKSGQGTLILSGNNDFKFTTEVREGTLLINGDQSAMALATTVSNGATIGGFGTIGGDLTVSGTLSPGDSLNGLAGPLTVNGATVFDAGSQFLVTLNGTGDSSQLVALGGLTLSSDTELVVRLGSVPELDAVYEIVTGLNNNLTGTFNGLDDGDEMTVGSTLFRINYWSDSITLTSLGAIPESSTAVFLPLVLLPALRRSRRRD